MDPVGDFLELPVLHQKCVCEKIHDQYILRTNITLPKTNISPQKFPSQKEIASSNSPVASVMLNFGGVIVSLPKIRQDQIPIDQRPITMWMFSPAVHWLEI